MRKLATKTRDNIALYKVVERRICNAISEGKLSPGQRLGSPQELAKSWGLSAGTLRQALQILAARGIVIRKPKLGTYVTPEFDPSDAMWQPPPIERSNYLAMVVPNVINADYATVMRGAESAAEAAKCNVVVANSEDDPKRLNQVIRQQVKDRVGGLIILTGKQLELDFEVIREICESQVPVVACYRPIGLTSWPVVRTDGLYNTWLVTKHLCDVGRKHIALYDFSTDSETELHFKRDGRMGFQNALLESRIMPDLNLNLEYPLSALPEDRAYYVIRDDEVDRVARWLNERPQVDGIVCVLPRLAAIVVRALKKLGKKIPADVAVAAMGEDGHLFGLGVDWLTAQVDRWSDVGQRACQMVLALREGETISPNTTVALKGSLIVGPSTAS
jgi:DNA-binding LacI/PurR family transcriptional regulator